ncbi:MAG TPA: hypothetical protein ENK83_02290 [Aliiroseovarius sp.]|nr:hypothetical protein [Aliiroseovarius sp.]
MRLARALHLDQSDSQVFHRSAGAGEWAISGGFEFSNWEESDLVGKARQEFANGWLGLESFGRVSLVAVARITDEEMAALEQALAAHFVSHYGAPSEAAALPVAREELAHMAELCAGLEEGTLLAVARERTEAGLREAFRVLDAPDATLSQIAPHEPPQG